MINTYSGPITKDWEYYCALTKDEPLSEMKNIKFYSEQYSYDDFCKDILPQNMVIWREDYKDRPMPLFSSSEGWVHAVLGDDFKTKLESEAHNKVYSNGQVTAYLYTQIPKQKYARIKKEGV